MSPRKRRCTRQDLPGAEGAGSSEAVAIDLCSAESRRNTARAAVGGVEVIDLCSTDRHGRTEHADAGKENTIPDPGEVHCTRARRAARRLAECSSAGVAPYLLSIDKHLLATEVRAVLACLLPIGHCHLPRCPILLSVWYRLVGGLPFRRRLHAVSDGCQ